MAEGTLEITISNQIVLATSISIVGAGGLNIINTLGGTLQLTETVLPADTTDKTVTWSIIAGSAFATISSSGLVTALEDGSVIVQAIANDGSGVSRTFTITITNQTIYVSNIIVSGAGGSIIIPEGNSTLQMNAVVEPPNADDPTFTWSVINGTGTATIDANGLLTKTTEGTVTIVATANDSKGNYGEQVITLFVAVVEPPPEITGDLAPVGWHIPSQAEFDDLKTELGGTAVAGGHMKIKDYEFWDSPNTGADNSSGFSAKGAGERSADGIFSGKNTSTRFLVSDDLGDPTRSVRLVYDSASFVTDTFFYKNAAGSVRCVKNSTDLEDGEYGTLIDIDGNIYQTKCYNGKEWMIENLRVLHYNDGTLIPLISDPVEWESTATGKMCWYDNIAP
jgi:uncharacterized protein (TIGR02145 family)